MSERVGDRVTTRVEMLPQVPPNATQRTEVSIEDAFRAVDDAISSFTSEFPDLAGRLGL